MMHVPALAPEHVGISGIDHVNELFCRKAIAEFIAGIQELNIFAPRQASAFVRYPWLRCGGHGAEMRASG